MKKIVQGLIIFSSIFVLASCGASEKKVQEIMDQYDQNAVREKYSKCVYTSDISIIDRTGTYQSKRYDNEFASTEKHETTEIDVVVVTMNDIKVLDDVYLATLSQVDKGAKVSTSYVINNDNSIIVKWSSSCSYKTSEVFVRLTLKAELYINYEGLAQKSTQSLRMDVSVQGVMGGFTTVEDGTFTYTLAA